MPLTVPRSKSSYPASFQRRVPCARARHEHSNNRRREQAFFITIRLTGSEIPGHLEFQELSLFLSHQAYPVNAGAMSDIQHLSYECKLYLRIALHEGHALCTVPIDRLKA